MLLLFLLLLTLEKIKNYNMRKLFCIITITMVSFNLMSQNYKIIERSSKKTPAWYNGTEQNYIIASAIKNDVEAAKRECLEIVKRNIIESVALNISSQTQSSTNQTTENRGDGKGEMLVSFKETFNSVLNSKGAKLPYISEISANKISDFYWEKRMDKKDKSISYAYCIKYPFSNADLMTLVSEFEEIDNEYSKKLSDIENEYSNIQSIEQIDKAIRDLDMLQDYFFDSARKNKAHNIQANYGALYNNISLKELSNTLGNYSYSLILRDKDIVCNSKPIIKSETASDIDYKCSNNKHYISYNYEFCNPNEDNNIIVKQKVGNRYIDKTIYFKPSEKSFNFSIKESANINAEIIKDSTISIKNLEITIPIENKNTEEVVINSILLLLPGINENIELDGLNLTVNKALYTIKVKKDLSYKINQELNKKKSFAKAYITATKKGSNEPIVKMYMFTFIPNW